MNQKLADDRAGAARLGRLMDPDALRQWTAALRSGEYTQGFGAIKRANNFCALGVRLVQVAPELWGKSIWLATQESDHGRILGEAAAPCADYVVALNDEHHQSFEEIADALEGKLQ